MSQESGAPRISYILYFKKKHAVASLNLISSIYLDLRYFTLIYLDLRYFTLLCFCTTIATATCL